MAHHHPWLNVTKDLDLIEVEVVEVVEEVIVAEEIEEEVEEVGEDVVLVTTPNREEGPLTRIQITTTTLRRV